MAAKTEWLSVRWRLRGLGPHANAALIDAIPVDQAPSWQLMCFASFFSLAGLLLGVVCLIGCKDLATNRLASSGKALAAATSSASSPRITNVNFPVARAQGQISPAANVVSFAPHKQASAPPKAASPTPLRITRPILPVGIAQTDYDTALVVRGGVPPYSWDATAGQIAPGLTLRSSAGTISGIPFVPRGFLFQGSSPGFGRLVIIHDRVAERLGRPSRDRLRCSERCGRGRRRKGYDDFRSCTRSTVRKTRAFWSTD